MNKSPGRDEEVGESLIPFKMDPAFLCLGRTPPAPLVGPSCMESDKSKIEL